MNDVAGLLNWPLMRYALAAASAACGLSLFWILKRDLKRIQGRVVRCQEATEGAALAIGERVSSLECLSREMEASIARLARHQNATTLRRATVIEMHGQGQSPDAIAASLRLPRNHVEFMVKVHSLLPAGHGSVGETRSTPISDIAI